MMDTSGIMMKLEMLGVTRGKHGQRVLSLLEDYYKFTELESLECVDRFLYFL
jgi:hypothetical protein